MNYPCLKINLSRIANNCRIIYDRCARLGISVVGVSKCVLGDIRVAEVFKDSGIELIGDSRLKNLKKLKDFFGTAQKLIMLRTPMISEIGEMVNICYASINTQQDTVKRISDICIERNFKHKIIIMIETDDRREGLLPEEVIPF
ncbi:MAG: alanine/ornithine racemase family PLP-dependent enzyme, partial [Actinobacteria bacterium]|nr:alanine/ornithine racemase family PLP-dependent enzyme [Actinomycetota bacterium]